MSLRLKLARAARPVSEARQVRMAFMYLGNEREHMRNVHRVELKNHTYKTCPLM